MTSPHRDMVATIPKPLCPICHNAGTPTYTNLSDDLFKTPGTWSARICTNNNCRTYWLDPSPDPSQLGRLYDNYTTHTSPAPVVAPTRRGLKLFLDKITESILAEELGYASTLSPRLQKILSKFANIHPGWKNKKLNQVLYVPFVENGRLLDVGCGGGHGMAQLERYGWRTTGTDFDEKAVHNATSKGLEAYVGDLLELQFESNSFDAILLSHVIEHVPNPVELLTECHRLLKPNGHLIVITPNSNSYGRATYGRHWRGLEVPRHLQVFTPQSLALIGTAAGFRNIDGKTCLQGLYYIRDASKHHLQHGDFEITAKSRIGKIVDKFKLYTAGIQFVLKPGSEETALLHCQK